jgi:hypothetical protein
VFDVIACSVPVRNVHRNIPLRCTSEVTSISQCCTVRHKVCTAIVVKAELVFDEMWCIEVLACLHGRGTCCAMGRLGGSHKSSSTGATRPMFRVHYRKLVDDCGENTDSLSFVPPLPDYLSYCCCQCGHKQKLKVRQRCNRHFASKHSTIQQQKIMVLTENVPSSIHSFRFNSRH